MLGATVIPTGCTVDKAEGVGYARMRVNCVNPSGPVVVKQTVRSTDGSAVSIVKVSVTSNSRTIIRR